MTTRTSRRPRTRRPLIQLPKTTKATVPINRTTTIRNTLTTSPMVSLATRTVQGTSTRTLPTNRTIHSTPTSQLATSPPPTSQPTARVTLPARLNGYNPPTSVERPYSRRHEPDVWTRRAPPIPILGVIPTGPPLRTISFIKYGSDHCVRCTHVISLPFASMLPPSQTGR